MSLLGTFLHASPYLAQALEQHRQRKRQAVLDHLAQRRAEADIAHLRTQDEIARQTAARIPVRYQVDEQGNLVAVPTQLSPDQLVGSSGSSTGAVPEPATSRVGPIPVADLFGLRTRPQSLAEMMSGPRQQPGSPLGAANSTAVPPALQAPSLADAVKRPAGPRPLTDFLPARPAASGSSRAGAAGSVPVYRTGIKGPKARIDPNSSEGIQAAVDRATQIEAATGGPVVPVMRDGKRVYVPRSEAAGLEAPAPAAAPFTVVSGLGPDGKPGLFRVPKAGGAATPVPGVTPQPNTRTGVPSEGERRAAALLPEIEDAASRLDAVTPSILTEMVTKVPILGNYIKTDEGRQFEQLARQFISNVIYAKSGLAVKDQEFSRLYNEFIPVPGDDEPTLEQKRRARTLFMRGADIMAGRARQSPPLSEADWAAQNPPRPGESYEDYHARYIKATGGA